jgi:hypothetical protein
MSKKENESKQPNETEIESASADTENTTPVSADGMNDSASSEASPLDSPGEVSPENQQSSDLADEASSEDLLDDVRRSLIDEETDKSNKQTKWWRRLGRKAKSPDPEPSPPGVEIDLPTTLLQEAVVDDQKQAAEPEEYEDQIDDLIDLLETEVHEVGVETSAAVADVETLSEPEPEIDFEQLKEQAFRTRSPQEAESESDVRSIALEGGEEVFVEVESRPADTFKERVSAFENALKPYRSYIYLTLGFLGIVLAGILSLLIFNAYQQSRPEPVQEVSNLPYPVAVSLPGGWSFDLGRGTLQAGKWEPNGAEWLEGTEVCRWVSLPWSRQLEAVLRTLNQNDPIDLTMSNNDKLTYGVYSVYEMTLEEIQTLDSNSPCLLLILTGSDSEKRWVLTAVP